MSKKSHGVFLITGLIGGVAAKAIYDTVKKKNKTNALNKLIDEMGTESMSIEDEDLEFYNNWCVKIPK